MSNLLSQKAVLAGLTIHAWTARRMDRKITTEVHEKHNAAADSGRYNKLLISKEALEPISQAKSAARTAHMKMTQPWFDEGARILPTALYATYSSEMRKLRNQFDAAADTFSAKYPEYMADANSRLNGMFNADDYPAPSEIRGTFHIDIKILPCPDAADFRVDLAEEHAADIRTDVEARMREALKEAMNEPVRRIMETVGHMAERLRAYKPSTQKGERTEGAFRDSLVENVRDLVGLLPAFNLTGDRALTTLTERIAGEVTELRN